MKSKNKVLYFSIVLILIIVSISFISADETDVIITGMKGYVFNLTVNMVKADGGDLIQSLENDTEASTGVAKFRFSSASQKVSFYIIARSSGKIISTATKKPSELGNYSTGAYVYIDLFPTTPSSATSTTTTTTITETTTEAENDTSNENATAEDSGNFSIIDLGSKFTTKASEIYGKVKSAVKVAIPWILWSLLGLVVLAGIVFGGWWIIKWNKKRYIFGTKNYEDFVVPEDKKKPAVNKEKLVKKKIFAKGSSSSFEDDLERAEEKIREAQEEIARIKSRKNRLSEAQKNYEAAKKELEEAQDEE